MRKIDKKKSTFSVKKMFKKIFLALILTVFIVCVLFVVHAFRVGLVQEKAEAVYLAYSNFLRDAGFKVSENILVDGRNRTDADDVKKALQLSPNDLITRVDLHKIQENLKKLPWVKQARVTRQLPNVLQIYLIERKPIALFQQKTHYYPIDEEGKLVMVDEGNTDELIIIVGKNAPKKTPELIKALDEQATRSDIVIKDRVMGAALIDERRWQLYIDDLTDGIIVELPEKDLSKSLDRLADLHKKHHVLDKQIRKLDLRFEGKQYVTPLTADSILKPFPTKEKR